MRVKQLEPAELTAAQKLLYEDMKSDIEKHFTAFRTMNDDGALLGPLNPWLRFATIGGPIWQLSKALYQAPTLAKDVREVVILVTGAWFHAAYELYAHVRVAEQHGLDDDTVATIVAGQRPANLNADQRVAYDVASSLLRGSVLPEPLYRKAVERFGEPGAAELIFVVGFYCMVSVNLNGFDVPVPSKQTRTDRQHSQG